MEKKSLYMCPYRDNVTTPTVITPTLNTSTVTDSLCNSGAFSNQMQYGTAHLT